MWLALVNALEQRLEDIITPMDVSIIGCVVKWPRWSISVWSWRTGGNKKSGYYLDGERQKNVLITTRLLDQLEAKIRAKVAQQDPKIELFKENSWQKIFKQFVRMNDCSPTESPLWQWIEGPGSPKF